MLRKRSRPVQSTTGIINGRLKCWDNSRVGLGLVDTLNDEAKPCVEVLGSSESRNIVFGSQMRLNFSTPKSHQDICMHRCEKGLCGCECCRNGTLLEEKEKTRIFSSGSSFHEETFLEEMALAL
ncbi:hypothetical protein OPV22_025370 [Ensete ventricosum]|uniref:Uncharacterized protein n=1 Tax=Ensete ventricosum TaxID=4639 RepID=A0AAV8QFD6_ENSVE|nr:hypothetical protein OPV22_025370 [Ensete ventricosum]